jgi:hypothetical protein
MFNTTPHLPVNLRFVATHFRNSEGDSMGPTGVPGEYVTKADLLIYDRFGQGGRKICSFTRYSEGETWFLGNEAWLPEQFPFATALFAGHSRLNDQSLVDLRDRMGLCLDIYYRTLKKHGKYDLFHNATKAMRAALYPELV